MFQPVQSTDFISWRPELFSSEGSSLPWFAVYVKNRHEKTVAQSITGRGYESFLPTYLKRHSDRKEFEIPLFPGYVFCRMETVHKLGVLTVPGVFWLVGNGSAPSPIPEFEIAGIRRMLESGSMVRPWDYIARGQQVRLKSGPLRGLEGVVVDETHEKWLVISINLLQRSVAVKVERRDI